MLSAATWEKMGAVLLADEAAGGAKREQERIKGATSE